jgi:hypothetical protein
LRLPALVASLLVLALAAEFEVCSQNVTGSAGA